MSVRIRQKCLAACFPPRDPLSGLVFRLAILREDLTIEFNGQRIEEITDMDRGDHLARRLYFTRRSFVTLFAMREVLQDSGNVVQEAIESACTKPEATIAERLAVLRATLNKSFDAIKGCRHEAGAHLDPDVFRRVLDEHGTVWGEMQIGDTYGGNFWRLAHKAALAALLPPGTASTNEAMTAEALKVSRTMMELIKGVVPAIDHLVVAFLVKHGQWS